MARPTGVRRARTHSLASGDDVADRVDEVALVEPGHSGNVEDLEGVEPPRAGGHHPGQGDVVRGVRDGPEGLLEVADLGCLEQRQAADHRVRDVLVAQPSDDRVAVLLLAIRAASAPAR